MKPIGNPCPVSMQGLKKVLLISLLSVFAIGGLVAFLVFQKNAATVQPNTKTSALGSAKGEGYQPSLVTSAKRSAKPAGPFVSFFARNKGPLLLALGLVVVVAVGVVALLVWNSSAASPMTTEKEVEITESVPLFKITLVAIAIGVSCVAAFIIYCCCQKLASHGKAADPVKTAEEQALPARQHIPFVHLMVGTPITDSLPEDSSLDFIQSATIKNMNNYLNYLPQTPYFYSVSKADIIFSSETEDVFSENVTCLHSAYSVAKQNSRCVRIYERSADRPGNAYTKCDYENSNANLTNEKAVQYFDHSVMLLRSLFIEFGNQFPPSKGNFVAPDRPRLGPGMKIDLGNGKSLDNEREYFTAAVNNMRAYYHMLKQSHFNSVAKLLDVRPEGNTNNSWRIHSTLDIFNVDHTHYAAALLQPALQDKLFFLIPKNANRDGQISPSIIPSDKVPTGGAAYDLFNHSVELLASFFKYYK